MVAPTTAEALREIRDRKQSAIGTLSVREQMIVEAQVATLDAWIDDLERGRSLEGLVARQHEADHEALFDAMTSIEATERLSAEIRQSEVRHGT